MTCAAVSLLRMIPKVIDKVVPRWLSGERTESYVKQQRKGVTEHEFDAPGKQYVYVMCCVNQWAFSILRLHAPFNRSLLIVVHKQAAA